MNKIEKKFFRDKNIYNKFRNRIEKFRLLLINKLKKYKKLGKTFML